METLTFRMNRKKAFLLHTAAIAFIAVGLFVLIFSRVFAARLVIPILFGLMAAFLMLLPRMMCLRLDHSGVEARSLYGCERILWSQVDAFRLHSVGRSRMIEIVFNGTYTRHKMRRSFSATLSGMEAAFANIYSVPLEEVFVALNAFRERSIAEEP